MYVLYSTSDLLSFIISNTDKHELSSIWQWIRCCNDVMIHVDCVIKRDFYPQKMHTCSKNTRRISVFCDLSLSLAHGYSRFYPFLTTVSTTDS